MLQMRVLSQGAVIALLVCAAVAVQASTRLLSESPTTLVILDNNAYKTTHSEFFGYIAGLGHKIEYLNILEEPLVLNLHGKWLADSLVIFAPNVQDFGDYAKTEDLIAFTDDGGSLLIAAANTISEPLRAIANAFGVDYDESTSKLLDVANDVTSKPAFAQSISDSTDAEAMSIISVPVSCGWSERDRSKIVGACGEDRKIAYSGIGHVVTPRSKFVRTVVTGAPTTFSIDNVNVVTSSGRDVGLVSAMQSLTSSRAVFTGSIAMFSNEYFAFGGADNKALATSLYAWVSHAKGLLRAVNRLHRKQVPAAGDAVELNPSSYRIKDDVHYEIELQEYDGASRTWKPYVTDRAMFELIMIDPYVRQQLPHVGNGKYALDLKVPDTFGVYKFRTTVDQFQEGGEGVGFIQDDIIVSIRPFRHTEYDRFLLVAYPYYTGAFTIMAGFLVFSALFLYSK